MKIILRKDVENLGPSGTLQNVANGYARNYLIPKGLAVIATPGEMKTYEVNQREQELKIGRQELKLQSFADRISAVTLQFEANSGPNGRLFGSVTAAEIAEQLSKAIGEEVDRRKIVLDEPIRQVGDHEVHVHLVGKLRPAVKVRVNGTVIEEPAAEPVVGEADESAAEPLAAKTEVPAEAEDVGESEIGDESEALDATASDSTE